MRIALLFFMLLLAGCQSPKLTAPSPNTGERLSSKVIVYREGPTGLGQGEMYFGEAGKSYIAMAENGSRELSLSPGKHVFEVTSKGTATFTFEAVLPSEATTCIKVTPNNANRYGSFVFPFLRNLATEFQAEVFACPSSVS